MDTKGPPAGKPDRAAEEIALIKASMPRVYAAIKEKAAVIGNDAYTLVRRGARGEADCFYAFEGGRVVGTPFCQAVTADVAMLMVEFGVGFVCVWPVVAGKGGDGAN